MIPCGGSWRGTGRGGRGRSNFYLPGVGGSSMVEAVLLRDRAVVMVVAAATTILFHRLRQPVVLGYLVAGVIIGPYTLPFSLVTNIQNINPLAELGVIFLVFSLGLEFSLRRLRRVGAVAL